MDAKLDGRGQDVRRALRALQELQRGRSLSVAEIQRLNEVSEGTARRTFELLSEVEGVERVDRPRPARLTYCEPALAGRPTARTIAVIASCLSTSIASLFSGSRYEKQMRTLRDDFLRRVGAGYLSRETLERKFLFLERGGDVAVSTTTHFLDDVLEAVLSSRSLRIRYATFDGLTDHRVIEPLSLVVYDHQLYVVAFHREHGRYHPFRVARIEDAELGEHTFDYPEVEKYDPAALFADSIGIFVGGSRPVHVRVRLAGRWATYARHHRWHLSQETRRRRDGRVDVHLRVVLCPELVQWVLSFGADAEVVAPKGLRDKVALEVNAMRLVYAPERRRGTRGKR